MSMHTRSKLEEAGYFLEVLTKTKDDLKPFYFNLSAFLNAWRSVLDVMLYDFAEYYSLGFTREDLMTDQCFMAVAKALKHREALGFIKWWRQKQGDLKQNPLWGKRILIVHRGYPTVSSTKIFYVSGSGGTSITTTPPIYASEWSVDFTEGAVSTSTTTTATTTTTMPEGEITTNYFSDFTDRTVTDMCIKTFREMEAIVNEAEKEFEVKL